MKSIFVNISVALLLMGCTSYVEEQIKPPIKLTIAVVKGGVEFIKRSSMGVFAVSNDGKNYTYEVCNDLDAHNDCILENRTKIVENCEQEFNKPCELVAINDQIVYPGEIDILNKKFNKGDRINYFTVPVLRDADKYMDTGTINIESLPDIYAEED